MRLSSLSCATRWQRLVPLCAQVFPKRSYEKVAPASALDAQASGTGAFIDVRSREAFSEVHAEGFVNIPHAELSLQLGQVPKGAPVYLLDHYGFYSELSAKVLEAHDYHDVRVVDGGLITWTFRGGPVTSTNPAAATRLKRNRDATASLPGVEAVAAEMGVTVDLSGRVFPLLDKLFDNAEDKEEGKKKSWVNRK